MNEKRANVIGIIICIVLFLFAGTLGTAIGLSCELGNVRHELDATRIELRNAENRQSEIREIVAGTSDILSQSVNSVTGIRKQIESIRKSYEEMERLLYNRTTDNSSSVIDSDDSDL